MALKVESPDIPHRTEANAVVLRLSDAAAVRSAYEEVLGNAKRYCSHARIDGVIVQAMAAGDVELAVGLQNNPASVRRRARG